MENKDKEVIDLDSIGEDINIDEPEQYKVDVDPTLSDEIDDDDFPMNMDISDLLPIDDIKHEININEAGKNKTSERQVVIEQDADEGLYNIPKRRYEDRTVARKKKTVKRKKTNKKNTLIISLVVAVIVVIAGIISYNIIFGRTKNQYNQYLDSGNKLYKTQQMDKAASEFLRADNVAYTDLMHISAKEMLYKAYVGGGHVQDAVTVLKNLITLNNTNESYYEALILLYQKIGDEESVENVYQQAINAGLSKQLEEYRDSRPSADNKGGAYNGAITVALSAGKSGNDIYYTLDGTEPTTESVKYTEPIVFGKNAEFDLKAVSVDSDGVYSQTTTEHYIINAISNPSVSPQSGDYKDLQKIVIKVPEGCTAYYTLDGSEPSEQSTIYDGNLDMPVGNSMISVVLYNSAHVKSSVITRIYTLQPERSFTYDDGLTRLKTAMVANGIINDNTGNTNDGNVVFAYLRMQIIDGNEYYLINATKTVEKTGERIQTVYAAGSQNGEIYRVDSSAGESKLNVDLSFSSK